MPHMLVLSMLARSRQGRLAVPHRLWHGSCSRCAALSCALQRGAPALHHLFHWPSASCQLPSQKHSTH